MAKQLLNVPFLSELRGFFLCALLPRSRLCEIARRIKILTIYKRLPPTID